MPIKETVYLAYDNAIDLQLRVDGAAVDLAPVTRMVLADVGCVWEVDSAASPGVFNWGAGGGVLTMKLGEEPVPPGAYSCWLIIHDPTNPDGIVWGEKLKVSFVSVCRPPAGP